MINLRQSSASIENGTFTQRDRQTWDANAYIPLKTLRAAEWETT
jgi:hypothetical protein